MTTVATYRRAVWREEPGRIFVDAAAYADFDLWHEVADGLRGGHRSSRSLSPDASDSGP